MHGCVLPSFVSTILSGQNHDRRSNIVFHELKKSIYRALPDRVTERNSWRKAPGLSARQGNQYIQEILAGIDLERLTALQLQTKDALGDESTCSVKYFDHRLWLRKSLIAAARLGLHEEKGLTVLDIGCGPGWFLAAANHLGHDCTGMDLPLEMIRAEDQLAYTAIPEILHCADRITRASIEKFTSIPVAGPYDLITCTLVCFDDHWSETPWGAGEWEYFLEDALSKLKPAGRLYLELNDKPDIHRELIFYNQETLNLFRQRGEVNGNMVIIRKP
jgi:SAM-dependent methyltransferase